MTQLEMPPMPETPHNRLNSDVVGAVRTLLAKYRAHNHILDYEVLTETQIDEVVNDLRSLIYKHEGIWKKRK